MSSDALRALALAIARRDPDARELVRTSPALARAAFIAGAMRTDAVDWFLKDIQHYVYAGDTLLHVAAVAYDRVIARSLLDMGADVRARNRRGAEPLHYAADGGPNSPTWDPDAQADVVALLVEAGADPNALDKSGVAPLHRAVRTRCTGAVRALLVAGANPRLKNKSGSTPLDLARQTTGRGGSGTPESKLEQGKIVSLLDQALR